MKKKTAPKQLLMNFTEARDAVTTAMTKLETATAELAKAMDGSNPETKSMVDDEMKEMRRSVKRLVGVLCDQTGMDFHKMWVMVYHEHHKRTEFHAVAASHGKGAHLDAVEEAGQLPALRQTVEYMLTSDRYGPPVVP
jgi:hypothetical protein